METKKQFITEEYKKNYRKFILCKFLMFGTAFAVVLSALYSEYYVTLLSGSLFLMSVHLKLYYKDLIGLNEEEN